MVTLLHAEEAVEGTRQELLQGTVPPPPRRQHSEVGGRALQVTATRASRSSARRYSTRETRYAAVVARPAAPA